MRPTALTSALDESNPLSLAYLVRRSLPDDQVGFIRGQISDLVALQLESFLQESEPRVDLSHREVQPPAAASSEKHTCITFVETCQNFGR